MINLLPVNQQRPLQRKDTTILDIQNDILTEVADDIDPQVIEQCGCSLSELYHCHSVLEKGVYRIDHKRVRFSERKICQVIESIPYEIMVIVITIDNFEIPIAFKLRNIKQLGSADIYLISENILHARREILSSNTYTNSVLSYLPLAINATSGYCYSELNEDGPTRDQDSVGLVASGVAIPLSIMDKLSHHVNMALSDMGDPIDYLAYNFTPPKMTPTHFVEMLIKGLPILPCHLKRIGKVNHGGHDTTYVDSPEIFNIILDIAKVDSAFEYDCGIDRLILMESYASFHNNTLSEHEMNSLVEYIHELADYHGLNDGYLCKMNSDYILTLDDGIYVHHFDIIAMMIFHPSLSLHRPKL